MQVKGSTRLLFLISKHKQLLQGMSKLALQGPGTLATTVVPWLQIEAVQGIKTIPSPCSGPGTRVMVILLKLHTRIRAQSIRQLIHRILNLTEAAGGCPSPEARKNSP
eukprot:CAMPEP_0194562414 /NCGR_PEP_ID=MMETSP0292-20121207/2877_1 /TAXON_ID=39354 /ORGANISM="Heterosigma akashiwo, Strain CCMP2393" /LENGTH=107 /DNA_ID=CAMNT_0039411135 /DNA_START=747 /DNA_END=1066 /DNA_ORIENTATION=-